MVVTAAPILPGADTALDIYANLVQRSSATGKPTYAQPPAVELLGNMASLHYDLRQAGLVPAAEENQTIAEQAALASGSAAYGSAAFSELQHESASDEAAIEAQSYGSVTGLWNQEMSAFKGTVLDELAYEGNQDLKNGNTLGFVGTGLKSSFFETFMPGSVGQTALMLGGGEVAGPVVGEFSRYATDLFPILGTNVTDAAGVAWNSVSGNLSAGARSVSDWFGNFGSSAAPAAAPAVSDLTVDTLAAHPLEGLSPQQIAQMAIDRGVATSRDSLILWSGLGKNGVAISQQYAQQLGGMTVEMTPGGSWLHSMGLFDEAAPFSQSEAIQTWNLVSQAAVELASGQVRAIVGNVNPTSTFLNVELPTLSINPNVTGLDQIQAIPTPTFTVMPNSFELQTTLPVQVRYGN